MLHTRTQLGSLLLRHGVITDEQLQGALLHSRQQSCRVGESLVSLGYCSEVEIGRVLAQQMELPFVDLQETPPTPQVMRLFSQELAKAYNVVPVRMEAGRLVVAALDPFDIRVDEVVRKTTGLPVLVASTVESQLRETVRNWTKLLSAAAPNPQAGSLRAPLTALIADNGSTDRLTTQAQQPEIVQKLNSLLATSVRKGATDIHFEAVATGTRLRIRVDGQMHPLAEINREQSVPLIARLKIMSNLSVLQSREPRSGVCKFRVDGKSQEWTVSIVPGLTGEAIVLKKPVLAGDPRPLESLGLSQQHSVELRRMLSDRSGGLLLVTGPAGSGRTTTLFALLSALHTEERVVIALEQKSEMNLDGVQHLQYDEREGRSSAFLMRICLDQEPDVIVLDEIRDAETAEVACRAAQAGRLVVCGVSAPSAPSALARLLDMGVPSHLAGAALTGVLNQKLVGTVCSACAVDYHPAPALQQALAERFGAGTDHCYRKGAGCECCLGRGIRGRTGVFELLRMDDDLRYLLAERVAPSRVQQHLDQAGFRSLEHDAFAKSAARIIPPDELLPLGLNAASAYEPPIVSVAASARAEARSWMPEEPDSIDGEFVEKLGIGR